jgi:hypothetical protein
MTSAAITSIGISNRHSHRAAFSALHSGGDVDGWEVTKARSTADSSLLPPVAMRGASATVRGSYDVGALPANGWSAPGSWRWICWTSQLPERK